VAEKLELVFPGCNSASIEARTVMVWQLQLINPIGSKQLSETESAARFPAFKAHALHCMHPVPIIKLINSRSPARGKQGFYPA
jgi:hypothetical protein